MPKWGKRKFEGGDDEGARIEACELSQYRKVVVRMWQGKVYVDFREFYTKDGKQLPGKKGISLSLEQWEVLRNHIDEVDKAIA